MNFKGEVEAVVVGYRRGSNTQYTNQVLLRITNTRITPHSLIGKRIIYRDKYGNVYRGKVLKVHGKGANSVVIASFKPNLPGQALGGCVKIVL